MSEILIHKEQIICRGAVIDEVLFQAVSYCGAWKSVFCNFLHYRTINLLVLVFFGRHNPSIHYSGQRSLPSTERKLATLVIFLMIFDVIFLLLIVLFFTFCLFYSVSFVGKFMIHSIVKVLIVELLISSIKFSAVYIKPYQLILVFHELLTVIDQFFLFFNILLSRIERTKYHRFCRRVLL